MESRNIDFNPVKNITNRIPPNFSTWQTVEISHECAKYAIENNIEGCFVECGIAAGNNFAALCVVGRHGYGFDSFEGIPWATEDDTEQPGIGPVNAENYGKLESSGISSYSIDQVRENMRRWNIENYTLVKGWFQHTVKGWNEKIAVLRLDGDMYESTKICLENMYPYLAIGGILIIDDWNLAGCRKAFNEYFKKRPNLLHDNGVTYWQKIR